MSGLYLGGALDAQEVAERRPVIRLGFHRDAYGDAGVAMLAESVACGAGCGRAVVLVVNRHGKTRCAACDTLYCQSLVRE